MSISLTIHPTFEEFIGDNDNAQVMLGYVAKRVGHSWAGDVLQDATIRMLNHWQTIAAHPESTAYIVSTLNSAISDFHRKEKRQSQAISEALSSFASELSLEAEVFLKLAIEELRSEANDDERAILDGHLEGYTNREIAERLQKPKPTIESKFQRFCQRIRNKQ